jgi:NitT/TauT family transport system substrate-binding protein
MPLVLRLIAICAGLVLIAGCGGSESSSSESGVTEVHVSDVEGVPSAFLEYGKSQGYFRDQGIDLEVTSSVGGAANIPAVTSGEVDVAGSNITSVLLAKSEGLPLRIISGATYATTDPKSDFSAVLVPPDSDIKEPADLAGKRIAVNTLKNIGDVTIKAALEEQGVPVDGIKFVEAGFPDMLPLLENGQVDAAWEIEPFVAIGEAQGLKPVLRPYVDARPGMMVGSFVTMEQFAAENPDVVGDFRAGVQKTIDSIEKNPEPYRKALTKLTDMDQAVADKMVIPPSQSTVDVETLSWMADRMQQYGLIDKPVDPNAVVVEGAAG